MTNVPTPPGLEYALTVELDLVGKTNTAVATMGVVYGQVTVAGGRFAGPRLSGVAVPGGGDSPMVRPDGVAHFEAVYFLREDDGSLIRLENAGLREDSPLARDLFDRGMPVPDDEYTLIATPTFRAPVGPHDWLNHSVFVGIGRRSPSGNRFEYYRVL